jgi:protein-tyrosine kinase
LVKPEKSEIANPLMRTDQPQEGKSKIEENLKETTKRSTGRDLNIRYSRTKVQVNDPERLKNNKIFSFFDEIETSNQIKLLRTLVLKKLKSIGGKSILVTSANPYEGKTFTSINLGVSIAKEFDRTVLIIDADLRQPTKKHTAFSTEFFCLDVEKGLTDYLMGDVEIPEILINPGISKLTLIPSGQPVLNSPELLNSSRMEEMMADIKSRYSSDRLVIVDGPAMLPFPDALILSRYVDAVLPVVEAGRTSTEDLKKMMGSLTDTKIIGTVFNKNKG